jgi:hypothetical protein
VPRVDGNNASLGELVRAFSGAGVRVPPGFATTVAAWRALVAGSRICGAMQAQLDALRNGTANLAETRAAIRRLILDAGIAAALAAELRASYCKQAERRGNSDPAVALRHSATADDLPKARFAGQQETVLNVVGAAALLDACRHCYASLFTDRAISYRDMQGFDHLKVALSIGVQAMVRADLGGSGIMFSIDTESGFPGVMVISAALGARRADRTGGGRSRSLPSIVSFERCGTQSASTPSSSWCRSAARCSKRTARHPATIRTSRDSWSSRGLIPCHSTRTASPQHCIASRTPRHGWHGAGPATSHR